MQKTSMARKVRVMIDGVERPGLVKLGEVPLENAMIDVPGFQIVRKIQTGVTTIPEVAATYEVRRDTDTYRFFKKFHKDKETHDFTVIYCDAAGVEFARQIWSQVECRKFVDPEVDLGSVSYARIDLIFLPYDILDVE